MIKPLLLSLAVAGPFFLLFGSASLSQDNRERRVKNSQSTETYQRRRAKAPRPAARQQTGRWPPCRGVLWVDALCQLDDGRVCYVDENMLIGCQ